jgi:DNA polymerase-1
VIPLRADIAGVSRPVIVLEGPESVQSVTDDIMHHPGPLAVDVETTGLDTFSKDFRIRTIQLATKEKAWVFQVEKSERLRPIIERELASRPILLAHNANFDLLALDRFGYLDLEDAWGRMVDTRLLCHLLDPRSEADGSVGLTLESVAGRYAGEPNAHQYKAALMAVFRENGWPSGKSADLGIGYRSVDLDEPAYLRYGGVDVLLTCWLYEAIQPLIQAQGLQELASFEMDVARACGVMQRRGINVDQAYAPELSAILTERAELATILARSFGVENVNSTAQVSEALLALGVELTVKTKTGKWKVDKEVLESIVQNEGSSASKLAEAVLDAKRSEGFRVKYVEKVIDTLGEDGRSHPSISSLQARTARMSVSSPPLQQIPSDDYVIRRLFIPSEGYLMGASDYDQIELRVMGGLAQDKAILQAVDNGVDLHSLTAERVGIERKVAKMTNFLIAYGGGAGKLALQAGIPEAAAKKAVQGWWRSYPGVKRYKNALVGRSDQGRLPVNTATGRPLPLDRSRVYAALNYVIQSTSRDVLAQAILDIETAGLGEHLLLPIHDEVLFEAPADDIAEVAEAIGEVMTMSILGTTLSASGEVYGKSWGHGYGATS